MLFPGLSYVLTEVFSCVKLAFYCIILHHFEAFCEILLQDYYKIFMGTLLKSSYTIPIPENATIKKGVVSWDVKGKKKTGKLSGKNKVLCSSEIWIAHFTE